MPCCASRTRFLLAALFLWLCAQVALAAGTGISVRNPQLVLDDGEYVASADFNINFNHRLEEAVNKGVVLYFAAEFELSKSRWYWFDEQVVRRHKTVQLAYLALPRQYRVSFGNQYQTYPTLGDAMRGMARLAAWPVVEKAAVKPEIAYLAGLQMRLDLSQMPKTFQVSALSNRAWSQSSDWFRWTFTVPETPPSAAQADPDTGEGK